MKKLFFLLPAIFMGMSIFLCDKPVSLSSAEANEAKVYKWRLQHDAPRADIMTELLIHFSEDVEKRSNGQLKIQIFAEPEIVPGFEQLQAVISGALDMANSSGLYQGGQIPVSAVEFGLPFMYKFPDLQNDYMKEVSEIRNFFYSSGMVDLLRKEYAKFGIYWLDMHSFGPDTFFSTSPMGTLDDFKGKKIFSLPQFGSWLKKMGAAPSEPAGGDLYMGLKLGTLDIVTWDINGIPVMNFQEVAPNVMIGFSNDQMIGHWEVNMKAWNSLPDELKQILADATKDWSHYKNKVIAEIEQKANKIAQTDKINLQQLDEKSQAESLKYAKEAWDEWAKLDKASAKAVELQKKWYYKRMQ
jgi:TRAP-type C4-dicarboxylate transport system substrate-binding protein